MKTTTSIWHKVWKSREAFIWITALGLLALSNPACDAFSLCPLHNLGFRYCPGCGMGHSISALLHGQLLVSWHAHPLGIPAVIILLIRIYKVLFLHFLKKPQVYDTSHPLST